MTRSHLLETSSLIDFWPAKLVSRGSTTTLVENSFIFPHNQAVRKPLSSSFPKGLGSRSRSFFIEERSVYKGCQILVREVGVKSAMGGGRKHGHKPDDWETP